ncbi:Conjugal transfer protein TraG [compost metagenome]
MVWLIHILAILLVGAASFFGFDMVVDALVRNFGIVGQDIYDVVNGNKMLYIMGRLAIGLILYALIAPYLNKLFTQEENTSQGTEVKAANTLKDLASPTGYIISEGFRIKQQFFQEHIVYLGPTGVGKTTSGFLPNLLDESAIPLSVVVNDVKRDLIQDTGNARTAIGSKVMMFAPFDPLYSIRINPLLQAKDSSAVKQLAFTMLVNGGASSSGNQDWVSMASPLLTSTFLAALKLEENPTVSNCIRKIIQSSDEELERYIISSGDDEALDSFGLYRQSTKAQSTSGGIRTVLGTNMQIFLDKNIEYVTSGNDLIISDLRKESISLYMHVPESKATYARPLMSTIYYLMFDILAETDGHILPFLLDEFANIGYIPNLDNYITVFRGRKMPFVLGIQSSNQISALYGATADTIMDNLKTKVMFPGMGPNSAEYASSILGDTTYKGKLLDKSYVRQIPEDTVLVVARNKAPVLDKAAHFSKNKSMVAKVANPYSPEQRTNSIEMSKPKPPSYPTTQTANPVQVDGLDLLQKSRVVTKQAANDDEGVDF